MQKGEETKKGVLSICAPVSSTFPFGCHHDVVLHRCSFASSPLLHWVVRWPSETGGLKAPRFFSWLFLGMPLQFVLSVFPQLYDGNKKRHPYLVGVL